MKYIKSIKVLLLLTIQFAFITSLSAQTKMKSDKSLTQKEQSIVPIAAFTAKGDTQQLRISLNTGLDAGLSINEIKEIMVQIYAYAGFPRTLNALSTFITVLEERKKNGIHDEIGKESSPVLTNENKLKKGTALQTKLLGKEMKTSTADFAPIIDIFLKEHLFADIFSRDILDFKTREIVTITTLASLGNAEIQLRSHINVGIYNGITETQLNDIATILKNKVGPAESNSMKEILKKYLHEK
ncbi:carboxymuconolactone decarboxylase family protein [Flavobacterium sp. 81]|uniref:carboxymuconolactone decarboxylase family protein n=1 Tax=Flavobacterium sp. 81 TaxID=2135621 RepID=UPI000F155305|nr:carboxymuconolactone decarboxylase family protein [Flavobacterium sp. 81]RKR04976.1 carboxymuconolactone decarboxylase family protein [Flavobacterium sp. 81]